MSNSNVSPDNANPQDEIWRVIPGFERYEASNFGRIKRIKSGLIRRPQKTIKGYLRLRIHRGMNGEIANEYVHSLVMMAFVGPRPDGNITNHINYVRDDCRPENLEYVTPKQNASHSHERMIRNSGVINRNGEMNYRSKLKESDIIDIRARYDAGESKRELAREYGVCPRAIFSILTRLTWKHVL